MLSSYKLPAYAQTHDVVLLFHEAAAAVPRLLLRPYFAHERGQAGPARVGREPKIVARLNRRFEPGSTGDEPLFLLLLRQTQLSSCASDSDPNRELRREKPLAAAGLDRARATMLLLVREKKSSCVRALELEGVRTH